MKPKTVIQLEQINTRIHALSKKADKLRKRNEVIIYYREYYNKKAYKFVKDEVENGGRRVWCRNGRVVPEATPCEQLDCKYKKNKNDIVIGCSICHRFQVTTYAETWGEAIHITPNWIETLPVGW